VTFSHFAVAVGLAWFGFAAYWLGRLHAQWERDQAEPERPADWAVEMAKSDPQRLINALRREELP